MNGKQPSEQTRAALTELAGRWYQGTSLDQVKAEVKAVGIGLSWREVLWLYQQGGEMRSIYKVLESCGALPSGWSLPQVLNAVRGRGSLPKGLDDVSRVR